MTRFARSPLALFLASCLAPLVACSGTDDGADDVPAFQPGPAPGPAPSPAPGAPPAAGAPEAPATSPTPGNEQAPAPGGIDTSGTQPAAMPGATPGTPGADPSAPAPADPAAPEPPGTPVAGSAGCGSGTVPAVDAVANNLLFVPPGYDSNTPTPLVFGFHGAGRTNEEQRMVDSRTAGSQLEANYIVAYMKSAGNAWDLNTDYPRFQAALEQIEAIACVDTASLFAFGHSSGAQFIAQMLGNPSVRETRFRAVAPVSSSNFGNPAWSPVPTLLIHGENDTARPGDNDGAQDILQYAQSNQCSGGTAPLAVPSCSSFAGDQYPVDPGCVQYQGCAAPTLFCRHDDPNYFDNGNPTNHGWPCFANSQIFQFFEAQRQAG